MQPDEKQDFVLKTALKSGLSQDHLVFTGLCGKLTEVGHGRFIH